MLDCWNIISSGDPNLTPGTLQIHWSIHANNKYLFIDALVTRVDYFSEIALTKILSLRFHTEQLLEMLFKSDPSLPPPLRTHHNIFFFESDAMAFVYASNKYRCLLRSPFEIIITIMSVYIKCFNERLWNAVNLPSRCHYCYYLRRWCLKMLQHNKYMRAMRLKGWIIQSWDGNIITAMKLN